MSDLNNYRYLTYCGLSRRSNAILGDTWHCLFGTAVGNTVAAWAGRDWLAALLGLAPRRTCYAFVRAIAWPLDYSLDVDVDCDRKSAEPLHVELSERQLWRVGHTCSTQTVELPLPSDLDCVNETLRMGHRQGLRYLILDAWYKSVPDYIESELPERLPRDPAALTPFADAFRGLVLNYVEEWRDWIGERPFTTSSPEKRLRNRR